MLVEIDSVVIGHNGPDSDVELAAIEKKWVLHVLLDHPRSRLQVFVVNEVLNVTQIVENLDSSALVERGRFDEPHILSTVLRRHPFLNGSASSYFFESGNELVYLILVTNS